MALIGVDVGTGSVRAGVFSSEGKLLGVATEEIKTFNPQHNFYEQSSDNIWTAVGDHRTNFLKIYFFRIRIIIRKGIFFGKGENF